MFSLSVYLSYFCNLTTHIININKGLTLHRVTPGDVLHITLAVVSITSHNSSHGWAIQWQLLLPFYNLHTAQWSNFWP